MEGFTPTITVLACATYGYDCKMNLPGDSWACHSLSDLLTGYDIFLVSAVEKRAPRNGIVGIEARSGV
jgi:hypothetical protein